MPVVTVTAPALDELPETLSALTAAVAGALGLPAEGVFATWIATGAGVLGARPHTWPIVVIHGGRRDPEQMAAAARSAEEIVGSAWGVDDVWVQWLVREDPP